MAGKWFACWQDTSAQDQPRAEAATPRSPRRFGSSHGGSTSCSPRCSRSSSAVNPGPSGRELEQHAARLEKIDRLEPESIDDLRRTTIRRGNTLAHAKLDRVVRHAPRHVMHRADAPRSARLVRHLADLDVLARSAALDTVSVPPVLLSEIREAEHAREKSRRQRAIALPRAHRMQTHDLPIGRNWTLLPGRCARSSLVSTSARSWPCGSVNVIARSPRRTSSPVTFAPCCVSRSRQ